MDAALHPDTRAVLEVIRKLDSEADEAHPELWNTQITTELGKADDDPDTLKILAELAGQHFIEPVLRVGRFPGFVTFRLSY